MEEILKSCITCRTPKDASRDFQQQKNECKACARQRCQERREKELASEQNKTCIHCATIGPVDQFVTLKNICRACNLKKKHERHDRKRDMHFVLVCSQCEMEKPIDQFKKGLYICKVCVNASEHDRRKKWSAERREQENEKNREYYRHIASNPPPLPELPADTPKMCTICLVSKRIDAFYRHKTKGTIRSACADCTKELKRQYYEENKER